MPITQHLLVSGRDFKNIETILSREFASLCSWLTDLLSLHLRKTILLGKHKMVQNANPLSVLCNGVVIKNSNSVKYLQ